MKLPFLLNSINQTSSADGIEKVFSRLVKVLPHLEGPQVSNALNLLSKKDVEQPVKCWLGAARALLSAPAPMCRDGKASVPKSNPLDHVNQLRPSNLPDERTKYFGSSFKPGSERIKGSDTDGKLQEKAGTILSQYSIRDAIIILNSFAKVEVIPPELIRTVMGMLMQNANVIDSHELSAVVHTLAKNGMIDDVGVLLRRNPEALQDCKKSEIDYSMLMRVILLNRDKLGRSVALDQLFGMFDSTCASMSDKSVAILVNSLARFGRDESNMLPLLVPIIIKRLKEGSFSPMCISQIANGVARLNHKEEELLLQLARRTCEDLSRFSTRCKVTVMNAFHKLDYFNEELFLVLVANLASSNADMTPQCIANTVSAVSHFNRRIPDVGVRTLFEVLSEKLSQFQSLDNFTIQNQVNILHGFSKVGMYNEGTYQLLGGNIMNSVADLKPIDAACILNAFARAKRTHALVMHICRNISNYLAGMKAQELSCCINSINNLRKHCDINRSKDSIWHSSIIAAANHIVNGSLPSSKFRPLDLRICVVCLADCNVVDHSLYDNLMKHLEVNIHRASMWDLVCIFSVLSKVGYTVDTSILESIARSLGSIGICKHRGSRDAMSLLLSMEKMGINHHVTKKLAKLAKIGHDAGRS